MLSRPSRSGPFQTQFSYRHFAQFELLDLAGHGHGKAVGEAPVARHFIVRDLVLAVTTQIVGRRLVTRLKDHPGHDFFTIFFVRHANYLNFLSQLMDSIGVILNMISSTMRTEELLQEVKRSNAELEAQAKELASAGVLKPDGGRTDALKDSEGVTLMPPGCPR